MTEGMDMQMFKADDEFWTIFPDAAIAVLAVKGLKEDDLSEQQRIEIQNLLASANEEAKKYVPDEPISANEVVQVWRGAYQKFPSKKGARCSIEALLKRVLHGTPIGSIVPSVDITNAISLRYAFPIGVENLDAIDGDLHLGVMKGNEAFRPIGSDQDEPPLPGEVAYYDQAGAVCRCWNWRDGQRTQMEEGTPNAFVAMECVEADRLPDLQKAMEELGGLLQKYLHAEILSSAIVTKENKSVVLR